MSTTNRFPILLVLAIGVAVFPHPVQAANGHSLRLEAGLAVRYPEATVRDAYASTLLPLWAGISWEFIPAVGLYGTYSFLQSKGETAIDDGQFEDPPIGTTLKVHTIKAGLFFRLGSRRFALRLGGGASESQYREHWNEGGITTNGYQFGFQGFAGMEFALGKRFLVLGDFEYLSIPVRTEAVDRNLGGLQARLGIGFRL